MLFRIAFLSIAIIGISPFSFGQTEDKTSANSDAKSTSVRASSIAIETHWLGLNGNFAERMGDTPELKKITAVKSYAVINRSQSELLLKDAKLDKRSYASESDMVIVPSGKRFGLKLSWPGHDIQENATLEASPSDDQKNFQIRLTRGKQNKGENTPETIDATTPIGSSLLIPFASELTPPPMTTFDASKKKLPFSKPQATVGRELFQVFLLISPRAQR